MPKSKPHLLSRVRPGAAALVLSCLALVFVLSPVARATDYQAEINALNSQNTQTQSALNGLQVQAGSYQQAIAAYQAQINDIDNAIAANQAKQAEYEQEIAADEAKIALNKQYLTDDLKTMYVQGQMTMIEQLATSQSLSTFVDKQVDDIKVQDDLDSLLTTIKNLQIQAQDNKDQVSALLTTEQAQQAQIAADQNQENQLLSMNQQQQDGYNSQLASNNQEIALLKAAQAAANASVATSVGTRSAVGGSSSGNCAIGSFDCCDIGYGTGGYPATSVDPWCDSDQDAVTDNYGFPNRECTSFANWYFTDVEGQSGFQVSGNAGWWWETSNFAVSTYPDVQVGAIGVEPSSSLDAPVPSLHGSYYGHVMIVLALPGTTYNGSFPYTSSVAGTQVPAGDVLVMSMNEDEEGHFLYDLWPVDYLMYINPQ